MSDLISHLCVWPGWCLGVRVLRPSLSTSEIEKLGCPEETQASLQILLVPHDDSMNY